MLDSYCIHSLASVAHPVVDNSVLNFKNVCIPIAYLSLVLCFLLQIFVVHSITSSQIY